MVWLVKDACGIACALLAWLMLGFAQYTLLTIILLPQPDTFGKYINIVTFELFSILAVLAHINTIFTDPGSVPQNSATPEFIGSNREIEPRLRECRVNQPAHKCTECCSFKPDRAHHCSVCKRCIIKMDHHCPWVNNCVGERNQKYFVLFTFYVGLISTQALVLAVMHFLTCLDAGNEWNSHSDMICPIMNRGRPSPGKLIMLVFLVFEALLFSLFSFIMFSVQMKAIWTDWTGIENLKKESRARRSGFRSFRDVCGSNFFSWFSPFTKPPQKMSSAIDQSGLTDHDCPV